MTKFLYVLVAILSALVTVWCSLSWTLCIAVFLGLSLLLLLLQQEGGVRLWLEEKWPDNDTALKRTHKGNNTSVDQQNKNYHKGQVYLKRKNSVNRNHNQNLGSDSEDEEIPGSVSTNARTLTTTIISIMSGLEKSISNSRLLSLFSVFNKTSNGENNRPVSSPGRYNNNNRDKKNGRQALRGNRRMAVGGDGTPHMSPSTRISRLNNAGIIGSPLSSPSRGRINTGYESGRMTRKGGSPSPQRQGRFASQVTPSSPLSTSPFPRFHRTACESLDRPGINPVGFTPHALQRPEVCYPSNSSPGVLPHVRLEKRIKIPLVESNINKMRSPVTVRIAPPDTGVLHSPKFTSLKQDLDFPVTPDTNDVLLALREGTRKRSNMTGEEDSLFESANNTAKRRRQESNHSTASSSSMPSLPDFLPDLSLCNFTPSSYMSPTSRYMVTSSAVSSSGSVTNPSSGVIAGSSGTGTGVKRPVAPCAHLSQAENSPNSKRPRQEVKNNPILSSLSSSQRYRLHKKDAGKRKIPDSPEFQDPNASKENQEMLSSDNHPSFEKPASKTTKLNRSVTEAAKSDADSSQPSVPVATTDRQSEETQANTSAGEPKTPDLRSRRKHLSFATPGINLDRLSYANVYATKQDYENDRKAEQERVEKMLDRIATEKKVPDADLLSEKNVVESREETTQTTSALTVPSMTISSNSKALTCTTAATSLIVSSTAASLTSSGSSPAKATAAVSSSSSSSPPPPTVSLSIFSSTASATTTPTSAMLPSTLSSLLQSNSSPSTSVTPSSTTSFITVPQTTKTDLPSTGTKPTATSISLTPTSTASAFQPSMFGSSATTTSVQSPSIGGFQFGIKTSSALSPAASASSPSTSSIPSTTSSVATNVTASGFSLGTFSMASATSASTAPTSTTFAFGARAASPQASPFTTGTTTTPAATTTNAGSLLFSSPSKEPPKQGGFSFALVSPPATPTSSATPKTDNQQVSSPFSTPKTQISSASSSSLFPFNASSAQTLTTATGAATAASTPATGMFTFGKSTPPVSLPQSSTPATSNTPSTGMFTFKPSDGAALKTSSSSVPTSNPTGMFAFKATADSTSAVTSPGSTDANFVFGTPATSSSLTAFGSSIKAPPAFGVATSGSTFGSGSSKFGATSTSPPVFEATTSASVPAFGATTPAFGATSSTTTPAFGATSSTTTPAFGAASSTTTPAFGATSSTTTPAFGAASSTTTPAFGATPSTTTPAFGATPSTTTPAFGATPSTTTPAFGATPSTTTPAFGAAPSTTTPVFGASSSSSIPAFASTTSASTPLFGSTKTAFGATSSPFGVSSTASTAFGGSTTTAFGASSTTTPLFGASNTQVTQANTSSTGSFSFDTNSNTARHATSTSAPSTGFNFTFNTAPTSPNTFNFGSTSTTSATVTTTTSSTAASSSTSIFGQPSSTFGGFSSANQDGQKSMFGSQSTNQSGFNFSGSSTNQTTNVFGQTGQQQPQTSLFHNSDQQQTSQPFTFGQGTTSGTNPTPFGQSSAFSSPQASSFGSFGAKPNVFATPTNNTDKPSQPTSNIFGSTPVSVASPNVTPQPKPLFGQVASQPFGGSGTTPSNTGNTGLFGTTPTGQTSTPAGGSATSGIFTFGQSAGTQQPAANPNQGFDFSASIGGTSQFTFGQGGTSSKPPMFNMGSGSTAPKMRSSYPKARRRGAKK